MLVILLEVVGNVLIENVAVFFPAAIVTEEGTVAAAVLELDSEITWPPDGATDARRTVPVDATPPATEEGLTLTAESEAASECTIGKSEKSIAKTMTSRFIEAIRSNRGNAVPARIETCTRTRARRDQSQSLLQMAVQT